MIKKIRSKSLRRSSRKSARKCKSIRKSSRKTTRRTRALVNHEKYFSSYVKPNHHHEDVSSSVLTNVFTKPVTPTIRRYLLKT